MQQERKLRYNMCILFLYYCDKPSADGYRLIVASNRDEYYDRPTARATFWEKNPKIIAGKIVQITPCKAKWGNPYSGIPGTICLGNLESWVLESVIQLSSTDKGTGIQSKTVRLNREAKSLGHIAMVAKFSMTANRKRHLKSGFALLQTSLILFNFI